MVNEEKLKLMAKLASYEEHQGKSDFEIVKRMRSDYISYHVFLNCLFVSVALLLIFGMHFAEILLDNMTHFTTIDFVGIAVEYVMVWVLLMLVYSVITSPFYRKRYNDAQARVNEYRKQLIQLDKFSKNSQS